MRSSAWLASQRRVFVQGPPDVRVVAQRLRLIDLLCDVTLVFNEDESKADESIDAAKADEKAAPLLAHKLILAASSTYFYEVFGKFTSTGMMKLWLPPPISRPAMSVILDWMYGVDVYSALLVNDVGFLREVKECAEVLQLTTFVQSIQDILYALSEDTPKSDGSAATAIKSEIIDEDPLIASGTSATTSAATQKRNLDPCLRTTAASLASTLSTEELEFRDKMIQPPGGQYQFKDCSKMENRVSSFKFHRNFAHGDDQPTGALVQQAAKSMTERPSHGYALNHGHGSAKGIKPTPSVGSSLDVDHSKLVPIKEEQQGGANTPWETGDNVLRAYEVVWRHEKKSGVRHCWNCNSKFHLLRKCPRYRPNEDKFQSVQVRVNGIPSKSPPTWSASSST